LGRKTLASLKATLQDQALDVFDYAAWYGGAVREL
jgi:hypothetical protein